MMYTGEQKWVDRSIWHLVGCWRPGSLAVMNPGLPFAFLKCFLPPTLTSLPVPLAQEPYPEQSLAFASLIARGLDSVFWTPGHCSGPCSEFPSRVPSVWFQGLLLLRASCLEAFFDIGKGLNQASLCQTPLGMLYWMAALGTKPVVTPLPQR